MSDKDSFKVILMNNMYEECCGINNTFVNNIKYNFREVDELSLSVPNIIMEEMERKDNYCFKQFKGKNQQIIIQNGNNKERFVVTDCSKDKEFLLINGEKSKIITKNITAKSYEYTLKDKTFELTEDNYCRLYNSKDSEDTEAILNMFVNSTGWSIGHISNLAQVQEGDFLKKFTINIGKNVVMDSVFRPSILIDKIVNINSITKEPLNINISYDITAYNGLGEELKHEKINHTIENINSSITSIKAQYTKGTTYTNACYYYIKLANGETLTKEEEFTFLENMKIVINSIDISYTNGTVEHGEEIKYRNFSEGAYNWYDFLTNNIALAYDCAVLFDTYNLTISVYSNEEIGKHCGMKLGYGFIESINETDLYDDIVTKMYVYNEDCSISNLNPFGNVDYLLNYDYPYRIGLMSKELMKAWDKYKEVINNSSTNLTELMNNKTNINKQLLLLETERTTLDYAIGNLELVRTGYQKDNAKGEFDDLIADVTKQINEKTTQFQNIMSQISALNNQLENTKLQINNINAKTDVKTATYNGQPLFNEKLLRELDSITIETEVNDTMFKTDRELYNYYTEKLAKQNELGIEFTINTKDLLENLFIPEGIYWNEFLALGNFIDIEDEEIMNLSEYERGLRIIGYTYIPKKDNGTDSYSIASFTLSNKDEKSEEYSGVSGLGRTINNVKNLTTNYTSTWKESQKVAIPTAKALTSIDGVSTQTVRKATTNGAVKSVDRGTGDYIIDAEDENKQLFIGASLIAFTEDKWTTSGTAISPNGVVGKSIKGEILLGKELHITSDDGKGFYIGGIKDKIPNNEGKDFGLQIRDKITETDTIGRERVFLGIENGEAKLRLVNEVTNELGEVIPQTVLSESGNQILDNSSMADNLDGENPFEIPYRIGGEVTEIRKATLSIYAQQFRAYEKGASSSGQVTSTSGASSSTTTQSAPATTSGASTSTTTTTATMGSSASVGLQTSSPIGSTFEGHTHVLSTEAINTITDHTHNMEHTHEIPSHTHNMEHTHSIEIEGHTHDIIYGIYKSTLPTNMSVYVNDELVVSNLNGNYNEVDITKYLVLGKENKIKITSDTLGRIVANVWAKMFATW